MRKLSELKVLIRGAGEVASGVAYRLYQAGCKVCLTEIASPVAVCRGIAFSEAVFDGVKTIMGVTAELVDSSLEKIYGVWERSNIPLVIDPGASIKEKLKPEVVVDAIMAKRNIGTKLTDAQLVIGVGPGFYAGRDVHIVIESNHSGNLGKVVLEGEAERNTGVPVAVGGLTRERVIWSPQAGIFTTSLDIGDSVAAGEVVGQLGDLPLKAPVSGILRGLIKSGVRVFKGAKLFEVDPVHDKAICNMITTKVWTIGDGVLRAITMKLGDS
jgi:xanthine dehydrogenase accessory factor